MTDSHISMREEFTSWLKPIIAKQNIFDYSVDLKGTSEKGDGYIGDIFFVQVSGNTSEGIPKTLNWVIKCGKRSDLLRSTVPVREAFENEMYMYDTVFPFFTDFQKSKGLDDYFHNFPKCYGTILMDRMEIIVLQNLKQIGYDLWDRKKPLTTKPLEMVLKQYAKWHATSIAIQNQQPERFNEIARNTCDVFEKFCHASDIHIMLSRGIDDCYSAVKDSLDGSTLQKWLDLKKFIPDFIKKNYEGYEDCLKVISHGDCWNNNFMYHFEDDDTSPSDVAFLDWQMSTLSSPIFDLSYFLYACVSEDDLNNFDQLIKLYHDHLANHLEQMESDADELYPFKLLQDDWKKYSRYGIMLSSIIVKIALSDKDDVMDMAETLEEGLDVSETFRVPIKDITALENRMSCIIRHAVDRGLV